MCIRLHAVCAQRNTRASSSIGCSLAAMPVQQGLVQSLARRADVIGGINRVMLKRQRSANDELDQPQHSRAQTCPIRS